MISFNVSRKMFCVDILATSGTCLNLIQGFLLSMVLKVTSLIGFILELQLTVRNSTFVFFLTHIALPPFTCRFFIN